MLFVYNAMQLDYVFLPVLLVNYPQNVSLETKEQIQPKYRPSSVYQNCTQILHTSEGMSQRSLWGWGNEGSTSPLQCPSSV